MKTLMIASMASPFCKETYAKLIENGIEVSLLDFDTLKFYEDGKLKDESYAKSFQKYLKLPKIHMIIRMFFIAKFLLNHSFKAINIHFVYVYYILIYSVLAKNTLIFTIYGSDFYRMNPFKRWLQKFLYQKAKTITFTNSLSQKSFLDYYGTFANKTKVCRFGLGTLDFIDKNREKDVSQIKQILGFSQTKTIVTCGYNATKGQQHEAIIKNISLQTSEVLKKVQFIFPMTYGDRVYRETIKGILEKTNLDYIILEEFLYEDKNAYIKLASDVMINMLQTDSFSGSMQEFLYANNIVITGSWLPYQVFDEAGIYYHKIDAIIELGSKLSEVLASIEKEKTMQNSAIIDSLSSWKNNIKSWIDTYES